MLQRWCDGKERERRSNELKHENGFPKKADLAPVLSSEFHGAPPSQRRRGTPTCSKPVGSCPRCGNNVAVATCFSHCLKKRIYFYMAFPKFEAKVAVRVPVSFGDT